MKDFNYKGYRISIDRCKTKHIGVSNKMIYYSIFSAGEEIKTDATYDYETTSELIRDLKKFIDDGCIGDFCDSAFFFD